LKDFEHSVRNLTALELLPIEVEGEEGREIILGRGTVLIWPWSGKK
jgi:hypothetical protein